jgi:hypothetical protein
MRETDPALPRLGTDPIQVWLLTWGPLNATPRGDDNEKD